MEGHWTLTGAGDRLLRFTRSRDRGGAAEPAEPLLTVREVCRRLRRSRRQVYRYLRDGRLQACARILGQWLFAEADVALFGRQPVPRRFAPLFWDVRLAQVDARRHRDFILGRVLEDGERDAVRWAFRTYPRAQVAAFLTGRGADLLSRRTWHFWAVQMGVDPRQPAGRPWRRRGRQWGGFDVAA